ncbi:hypothetical protein BDP81DRAFT_185014 [Colletotrichum phormii]|uniref:Uncharacterized protein n=1 Tax=Colletotrichum phormii TaxID=359342 RepID=A0AAI9ZX82_9PEZI|nr:uncharacterized protein BDP81DRAFT_185014 [Colletotrichum phormii]KAK1639890.1 hypothetical protein BDP81DRAFT_185014 [Colletotrichum phormii]
MTNKKGNKTDGKVIKQERTNGEWWTGKRRWKVRVLAADCKIVCECEMNGGLRNTISWYGGVDQLYWSSRGAVDSRGGLGDVLVTLGLVLLGDAAVATPMSKYPRGGWDNAPGSLPSNQPGFRVCISRFVVLSTEYGAREREIVTAYKRQSRKGVGLGRVSESRLRDGFYCGSAHSFLSSLDS